MQDVTDVIHQRVNCRGKWEMVQVDDNRVIEESSFMNAMRPEAIFAIVQQVQQLPDYQAFESPSHGRYVFSYPILAL